MERAIRHTWFFPHSPERVWEYLTKPELLAQWLMESNFRPEVGHRFQFHTKPIVKFNFDGNIYCQVLELEPNKKLVYSWKGGNGKGEVSLDSLVTWTLAAKNGGTELQLVHSGFKGFRNFMSYIIMNQGWLKIAKRFLKNLNQSAHVPTGA
ncbi:SRPBCC domain-containing protein [Chitinophaga sp. GCM10012297]|uniref:SRPBCC domain-containing protein n=1 Tax=Chitinophaga chungangae TaxID=2821488 RepID=A0ABS3YC17_9BACT|nr:SRPBCC domain-containing protein [Chitinophaga chungangae]MBO9152227.1 SRPBCC domain-containing protein [Chitinophaga chungangae]